jgi:hypothetical protein
MIFIKRLTQWVLVLLALGVFVSLPIRAESLPLIPRQDVFYPISVDQTKTLPSCRQHGSLSHKYFPEWLCDTVEVITLIPPQCKAVSKEGAGAEGEDTDCSGRFYFYLHVLLSFFWGLWCGTNGFESWRKKPPEDYPAAPGAVGTG